jgi:hypothetical protein
VSGSGHTVDDSATWNFDALQGFPRFVDLMQFEAAAAECAAVDLAAGQQQLLTDLGRPIASKRLVNSTFTSVTSTAITGLVQH